ncbi:MAG: hypothetical protein QNJ55_36780 [Xenococcus sp. MO_188.B8]|nr:hypothetical protein [Xenococcus sp. MO_188.B8]
MKLLFSLEKLVQNYQERLLSFDDVKNNIVEINPEIYKNYSKEEILCTFQELTFQAEDPFQRFAIAKYALTYCTCIDCILESKKFFPIWLESCTNVGAYEDCIRFTDKLFKSREWQKVEGTRQGILIYLRQAKALRNIGEFPKALNNYRKAIEIAKNTTDIAYINIGLLLIGKLYGNYLGQRSLFSSFVEEAKSGLEKELNNCQESESKKFIKYIAICHDALGQAYDQADPKKAKYHFLEAINLNEKIQSRNGISRASCHLNRLEFNSASAPSEKKYYLKKFAEAIELLSYDSMEKRGLGIRQIQYALLLNQVNKHQESLDFFLRGKEVAKRYSDYKTIAWSSIVESELYNDEDPIRSIKALKNGLKIAQKYRLLFRESEINLRLAEMSIIHNYRDINPTELFERNREISRSFIDEVKKSLKTLNSQPHSQTEFNLFSITTKNNFRDRLLLDFDYTVEQLDSNIQALTKALQAKERRQQELLILGIVNSVARELLHEVKVVIPENTKISPFQEVFSSLNKAIRWLQKGEHTSDKIYFDTNKLDKIISLLKDQSERVNAFGEKMTKLKNLLSTRLKRPRSFEDEVSFKNVCSRAAKEIGYLNSQQFPLELQFKCDIIVTSNEEMMVTVVQNLIRNAYEAFDSLKITEGSILIQLYYKSTGNLKYGNPSRAGIFAVVNQVTKEKDVIRIRDNLEKGLKDHNSTKKYGSGVGLELANTVFVDLMKATLQPVDDSLKSGLEIVFPTGTGRARIVYDE